MDSKTMIGIEKISTQELEIVDTQGRKLLLLSAKQGKPAIVLYNGRGKIDGWVTGTAEGTLELRTFDETGEVCWQREIETCDDRASYMSTKPARLSQGPEIQIRHKRRPKSNVLQSGRSAA